MKSNSVIRVLCVTSVLSVSGVSVSFADSYDDMSKWYLGVGAGVSSMSPDPRGSEYKDILKDDDIGFKVFGGYNIHPNWSVEAYYSRLGESEVDATKTINNLPTQRAIDAYNNWKYAKKGRIGYETAGFTGLWFPGKNNGRLTGGRFNYFLGTGLSYLKNEPLSNEQNKKIKYKQNNAFSLMLTGGVEYELSKQFVARLSADSYNKDMNIYMLGLTYSFGSDSDRTEPVKPITVVEKPKSIEVEPVPVIVQKPEPLAAPKPAPVPVNDYALQVKSAVIAWAESWQAQDINGYIGSYTPEFKQINNLSHETWQKVRKFYVERPARIDLNLSNIYVKMLNSKRASARFLQKYRSNIYQDTVLKELTLVKINGVWLIDAEKVIQQIK